MMAHPHSRFSARLAFILNNPLRRILSPPEELLSKLSIGPKDVVVDFGCGPGFYTIPLAKLAAKTIAVDVSSRMLEKTASNAKKEGVTLVFLESDGTEIKLPDHSVDLIFLNHVFHEVENKERALSEFHRVLKHQGRLAIIERTSGKTLLPGPPLIDEKEVIGDIERAGFTFTQTIPNGKDSLIIAAKTAH